MKLTKFPKKIENIISQKSGQMCLNKPNKPIHLSGFSFGNDSFQYIEIY